MLFHNDCEMLPFYDLLSHFLKMFYPITQLILIFLLFKTIPLSSGETIPYGIIYSKAPTDDAIRFLDIIKNVIK